MSSPIELVGPAAGTRIRDDFAGNSAVADALIGEVRWERTTIGNASTPTFPAAERGILRLTTAATANGDGEALSSHPDGLLLGSAGATFECRIGYPVELASGNFRVGMDDSVTATRPTVGITFESDAGVLSCNVDSADHGDNALLVTGVPTLTGGTTMVVGVMHVLRYVVHGRPNAQGGPSHVSFWVDGHYVGDVVCNIDNDEEVEAKIVHWQDSGSADAVALDIDYFDLWLPRAP